MLEEKSNQIRLKISGKFDLKSTNLGLDAVREEEHKTAKLLFTKGSSLETIMEHLLRLNEMEAMVKVSNIFISRQIASNDASNHAMWSYHKDHSYIMPAVYKICHHFI